MSLQTLITNAEKPLPRSAFGFPLYPVITTFTGMLDENGTLHITGISREQLLRTLITNAHGRLFSSDNLARVVREVSRLCNEHDGPDAVGFDDLSCAIDRGLEDRDASLRMLDERADNRVLGKAGVSAEEKAVILDGLAFQGVDCVGSAA